MGLEHLQAPPKFPMPPFSFALWRRRTGLTSKSLGAHAEINLRSIGLAVEALLFVQVSKIGAGQVDDLVRELASVPEVRHVFLVSGHFDLIVHVAVCDMEHLKSVISERFHQAFVVRVETSIVFNHMTHHEISRK